MSIVDGIDNTQRVQRTLAEQAPKIKIWRPVSRKSALVVEVMAGSNRRR